MSVGWKIFRRGARVVLFALGGAVGWAAAGAAMAPGAATFDMAALARTSAYAPEAVKAAYLVNFIRFTTWPEEARSGVSSAFVIAVANDRALEDELVRITSGQSVRGRPIRVTRVRSARELEGAHVAWFRAEGRPTEDFSLTPDEGLAALGARPTLSVSDQPGFVGRGGMVQLYLDGASLRFEISPKRVRAAGLEVSSRLLALSRPAPSAPSSSSEPPSPPKP